MFCGLSFSNTYKIICSQISGLLVRSLCVHAQIHPSYSGAHLQRSAGQQQR